MKALALFIALLSLTISAFAAPLKIGVLLKDRDLFWSAAERGAQQAGSAAGVELIIKAPVVPNSLPQQSAMLDALLKEPIDALVIAPLSENAYRAQLAGLAAKGVKIVALDTNLADNLAATFVGYNQVSMAEAAGRFFAELVGDTDSAGLLRAYSLEGMSVREKTLLAAFKQWRPNATLHTDIFAGSERQDDLSKSQLLLEKHPEVKAVCTPFSASTMAMTKALQAKGLAGKVQHVGFGTGLPDEVVSAIEQGAMHGWVAQQPNLIGRLGVEAAVKLAQGQAVPATLDVPYTIVTKANLNTPEVQAIRN